MPSYTETWDVTRPDGSSDIALGDDVIRQDKRALDERLNEDHVKPSDETGFTTVGYHRKSQYVEQASDPANVANTGIVYTKDDAGDTELFYQDDGGAVIQLTADGKLNAAAIGGVYAAANVAALVNLLPFIYPIGAVVTFGVSTNPNTLFGFGTWTAIAGKVIVGIDGGQTEFDTLDETGGEKTHTLTLPETPAHTHTLTVYAGGDQNGSAASKTNQVGATASPATSSAGGDGAHNNLQPYIVKYVWQRTA